MVASRVALAMAATAAFTGRLVHAFSEKGDEVGKCQFENDPRDVGSYWDPTCHMGMLGCNGDGKNLECRLCGAGDYVDVPCPPSSCHFPNDPFVSYYWDKDCVAGKDGCWADGMHAQCRFCGQHPFTNIPCPEGAAKPHGAHCSFDSEPETPYFYDPSCVMGKHGCKADGKNVHCRFCGKGAYKDISCAAEQVCKFAARPTTPFFWDPTCKDGMLGCRADGLHPECRFCAKRPFQDVECPSHVKPKEKKCDWPKHSMPQVPSYWEETCKAGMAGCWADGIHAQCRFCGGGAWSDIECPKDQTAQPLLEAVPPSGAGTTARTARSEKRAHDMSTSGTSYNSWNFVAFSLFAVFVQRV